MSMAKGTVFVSERKAHIIALLCLLALLVSALDVLDLLGFHTF